MNLLITYFIKKKYDANTYNKKEGEKEARLFTRYFKNYKS